MAGADPEAADFALGQGAAVKMVGLDVTHSCLFTGTQLAALAGRGRFGSFLAAITGFYLQYHRRGFLQHGMEENSQPVLYKRVWTMLYGLFVGCQHKKGYRHAGIEGCTCMVCLAAKCTGTTIQPIPGPQGYTHS